MVAIAQLVEHLIVVQKVARSSRVGHPSKTLPFAEGFCFSLNSPLLPGTTALYTRAYPIHRT